MQPAELDSKKLYYAPLSIKSILSAQGEECKIDNLETKSAIIVGRVVQRFAKEPNQMHYLINDCTGSIYAIDYNASQKDAPSHKDYEFIPYGYVRVHGEILRRSRGNEIKLESISNITDHNEMTNHWLYVTTTRCIRKYGPLSEDELRSAETTEKSKYEGTSDVERLVIDAIKTMKAQGKSLDRDEIHDLVSDKIKYVDFLKLIDEMVSKQILRTNDKFHYDLH